MQYGPKNLLMKERKLDNLPTECILEFSVKKYVKPSYAKLWYMKVDFFVFCDLNRC